MERYLMVKNLENLSDFNGTILPKVLDESGFEKKKLAEIRDIAKNMKMEFKKWGAPSIPSARVPPLHPASQRPTAKSTPLSSIVPG